jgi:peptide/nickel transport system permease protein
MTGTTWQRLKSDPLGVGGLCVVVLFALVALCVWSGLLGQGWSEVSGERWENASSDHWFGTNLLGQDILQRTLFGTATAFEVGLIVTACSTILGTLMGALAGWYSHSWLDELVLWLKGVLDSIPFYLFAAAVAFALQGNPWAMHLAMIVTFWTTTARIIRGEVMRIKEREFIEAARAIGLPGLVTVFRHVLPNTFHILLVQGSIVFVAAINTLCCRDQYRGHIELSGPGYTGRRQLGPDAGRKLAGSAGRPFWKFCRSGRFVVPPVDGF